MGTLDIYLEAALAAALQQQMASYKRPSATAGTGTRACVYGFT
jgi:hypothetical protein